MTSQPHQHEESEKYEKKDANVRGIVVFAIGLLVFVLAAVILSFWAFDFFKKSIERQDTPPFYIQDEQWRSPDIVLETHPSRLYENYRRQELQKLTTYAWIDRERQVVRIPVEEAIRITARQGLPYRDGISNEPLGAASNDGTAEEPDDDSQTPYSTKTRESEEKDTL